MPPHTSTQPTRARPAPAAGSRTSARPGSARPVEARPAGARPVEGRPAEARLAPADPTLSLTPPAAVAPDPRGFAELGVPAPVVAALVRTGITAPFPIQAATLPDTLAGRDVLGRGRTGSGKTVAFAVPMVVALSRSTSPRLPSRPRALVLVPTRELANQVAEVITPLAAALGQRVTTVFGGVGQGRQVSALRAGVDVLVACPGRLEDLIGQGLCDLGAVEVTVLDEADHMADLGFLPGVKRLLDRTPAGRQRMLFSATLDNGVDVLVRRYLRDPVTHSVDPAVSQVSTMTHHVLSVDSGDKAAVVRALASGHGRSLLFMRTKHTARKLASQLTQAGIPAVDLHGNLSQNARERNLAAFTDGSVRVLVATDIAARGIHVDDIGLVVHVDPPTEHKAYLHRSGRTARAGAAGVVVTVATHDQAGEVRTLARQAGIRPTWATVAPGDEALTVLVGPSAPLVTPAPRVEPVVTAHTGGGRAGGASRSGSVGRSPGVGQPGGAGRSGDAGRPSAGRSSDAGRSGVGGRSSAAGFGKVAPSGRTGGSVGSPRGRGGRSGSGSSGPSTSTVYSSTTGSAASFSQGASGRRGR